MRQGRAGFRGPDGPADIAVSLPGAARSVQRSAPSATRPLAGLDIDSDLELSGGDHSPRSRSRRPLVLSGSGLNVASAGVDEETFSRWRALSPRCLDEFLAGRLLTPKQAWQLIDELSYSALSPEQNQALVERLLLHVSEEPATYEPLGAAIRRFPRDPPLVLAEVPHLRRRMSLLAPAYVALYREVASAQTFTRTEVLARALRKSWDGKPVKLSSLQVRELLLLLGPPSRADALQRLWSRWLPDTSRGSVLSAVPADDRWKVRHLVEEPLSNDARATVEALTHRELLASLPSEPTVENIVNAAGTRQLSAVAIRELMVAQGWRERRLQVLEGLLPRWNGEGDAEQFLSLLEYPRERWSVIEKMFPCPVAERSAAFAPVLEWLMGDCSIPNRWPSPPELGAGQLRTDEIAQLLRLYPQGGRLRVLRTLLLQWADDGRDDVIRAAVGRSVPAAAVNEAVATARAADLRELEAPGYRAFLDEGRPHRARHEFHEYVSPPKAKGIFSRLRRTPEPRRLTSWQLRHLLGWQGEAHAAAMLSTIGPSQWVKDGNEDVVLRLFGESRAQAMRVHDARE